MHHLIRIVFSIVEHALLPHHEYVATAIERFFASLIWVELKRPFSIEINGIKEILNEDNYNPFAVSYLLNAIYFNGEWTFKFDPDKTCEEPFNGGNNVFMMWQKSMLDYAEN
ncbi:MAG: hypothetical protein II449_12530, partial [Prevotella sp.]|nr:hypothetical protein [Prevotella sp.]